MSRQTGSILVIRRIRQHVNHYQIAWSIQRSQSASIEICEVVKSYWVYTQSGARLIVKPYFSMSEA